MNDASASGAGTSLTLIDRARSNDQDAWRRLVFLYAPLVAHWCRQRGIRREDADDVTQEVFRAVASRLAEFRRDREGDTFRGWLRAVAHSKAADWHRLQSRQLAEASGGTHAGAVIHNVPDALENDDDDPQQLSDLYRRALELVRSEFEGRTWQAFWRVAVDGETTDAVARALGLSTASVRQAKSRVLRRLRQELGDLID